MPADELIPSITLIKGYKNWPWRMFVINVDTLGHEPTTGDKPSDIFKASQWIIVDGQPFIRRSGGPGTREHTGLWGHERRPGGWSENHLNLAEFLDICFWEQEDDLFRLEVLKEDLEHLNAEKHPGIDPKHYYDRFIALESCSFDHPGFGHVVPARYIGTNTPEADLRLWSDCLYLQRISSLWGTLLHLAADDNPVSQLILQPSKRLKVKCELLIAKLIAERRSSNDFRFEFNNNFRSVLWGDQAFQFTVNQAAAVEELHKAYIADRPDVSQGDILNEIDSKAAHLRDVFKRSGKTHPAWGTMIQHNESMPSGTYRLTRPPPA